MNLLAMKDLLVQLHKRPLSKTQLREVTGLSNSTISRWMARLHTKPNLVYIESYRKGRRGNPTAIWAAGYMMTDAVRPRALTPTEYSRTYRAKKATRIVREDGKVIHHGT